MSWFTELTGKRSGTDQNVETCVSSFRYRKDLPDQSLRVPIDNFGFLGLASSTLACSHLTQNCNKQTTGLVPHNSIAQSVLFELSPAVGFHPVQTQKLEAPPTTYNESTAQ